MASNATKTNAKKPSEVKTDVPQAEAIAGGNPAEATGVPGAEIGKSPTAPDAVSEAAKLGGSTVDELRDDNGPADDDEEPAPAESSAGDAPLTLSPAHSNGMLLVGNTYTVSIERDFQSDDEVEFMHPNGVTRKAAVVGRKATGTFLVERARPHTVGFKINGKKVDQKTYDTYTGN